MQLSDYLLATDKTALYEGNENRVKLTDVTAVGRNTDLREELYYLGLGLGGESGEVLDCIKKMMRSSTHGTKFDEQLIKLIFELGDVAWYWIRLCRLTGYGHDRILQKNILKLAERHKTA